MTTSNSYYSNVIFVRKKNYTSFLFMDIGQQLIDKVLINLSGYNFSFLQILKKIRKTVTKPNPISNSKNRLFKLRDNCGPDEPIFCSVVRNAITSGVVIYSKKKIHSRTG